MTLTNKTRTEAATASSSTKVVQIPEGDLNKRTGGLPKENTSQKVTDLVKAQKSKVESSSD